MAQDVELECRCRTIHGTLRGVSPETVNRVICYCDDCQAFLHHLGRADLLDAHGGTDIVQVAPGSYSLDRGFDAVAGVRLKPKGLYRWYASCCKTPLGNTLAPSIPFIGIAHELFRDAREAKRRDAIFGEPRASILGEFAVGDSPGVSRSLDVRLLARTFKLILGWKLRGKAWPHPFFERETKAPRREPTTLTPAEREALRPLCGPRPARPR
jgi:hypothetical protein